MPAHDREPAVPVSALEQLIAVARSSQRDPFPRLPVRTRIRVEGIGADLLLERIRGGVRCSICPEVGNEDTDFPGEISFTERGAALLLEAITEVMIAPAPESTRN